MPGNSRQMYPHHSASWNNENEKITSTNESFERYLQGMNDQTKRITESVKALENEVQDLQARKKEVQEKASKISMCREKLCRWTGKSCGVTPLTSFLHCSKYLIMKSVLIFLAGLEIVKSTATMCNVAFPVFRQGKECGRYTIGFIKTENCECHN